MTSGLRGRLGGRTIRTRILIIAWIPSLALLLIGGSIAGYLGYQSQKINAVGTTIREGTSSGWLFIPAMQNELQASAAMVTDPKLSPAELNARRARTDQVFANFTKITSNIGDNSSAQYNVAAARLSVALRQLPTIRKRVDSGKTSLIEVETYYGQVDNLISAAVATLGSSAPNGQSAVAETTAHDLVNASTLMTQGNALAYAAFSPGGMSEPEYQQFIKTAGTYRDDFETLAADLPPSEQTKAQALMDSDAWGQQYTVERTVLNSSVPAPPAPPPVTPATNADGTPATTGTSTTTGTTTTGTTGTGTTGTGTTGTLSTPTTQAAKKKANAAAAAAATAAADLSLTGRVAKLPISQQAWEAASTQVSTGMSDIAVDHTGYGAGLASHVARKQLTEAYIAGGSLLVFALLVLLLTTRESNKLIGRLHRLRSDTMETAQIQLPAIVTRLRNGEALDPEKELPRLDYGHDEIGEVATAFDFAQRVAVAAAVQEADTRAGLRAVFLNIAYRSQVIVHRQLKVLERAEQFEEDPDQLKLLFELDHLATRARRNAENLVILGGGQPGRQWRNSVALLQIVRGAISEAEDYARVSIGRLPRVAIRGAAVGDVVHLLAEIVDNATSFSPPMSRVEVRANLVGRGLVLEVEDQGLGIPPEQLELFNEMMLNPPDFHTLSLREEPRLGMFVIAQLAQSQGIRVTLTPSPAYGGTKVVVLVPDGMIDIYHEEQPSLDSGPLPIEESAERAAPVGPGNGSPVYSLRERMAFESEASTGATGAIPASRDAEPEPGRRAPILTVAPNGPTPSNPPIGLGERVNAALSGTSPAGPGRPVRPGRPELPRRSRQTHLSEKLLTPSTGGLPQDEPATPEPADPDQARNRMAAFQRGTQRARSETPDAAS